MSLVRNEVNWKVSWGETVWESLPKFKVLTQVLASNYVFKPRPKAVKYLQKK